MGKTMKVVLFWPDTKQVSTENLNVVPEEDRVLGAPTKVVLNTQEFKVVVRLISDNDDELQAMEDKVSKEIDDMIAQEEREALSSTHRSTRAKKSQQSSARADGVASQNEVASALGERKKPPPRQAATAKRLAEEKKKSSKAQRAAQDALDSRAVAISRPKAKPVSVNPGDVPSTSKPVSPQSRRNLLSAMEDSENLNAVRNSPAAVYSEEEDDDEADVALLSSYSSEEEEDATAQVDNSSCCSHCVNLRKAFTKTPEMFLAAVAEFGQTIAVNGVQWVDVISIPDGVPKCALSKGSDVIISVADKDDVKQSSNGDPSKMARATLMALFGRDAFEKNRITALGSKQGTKGIKPNVRDAVKKFVNRHVRPPFTPLTDADLNRIINKKTNQIQRKTPRKLSVRKKSNPSLRPGSPQKLPPTDVPPKSAVTCSPSKTAKSWKVINEKSGHDNQKSADKDMQKAVSSLQVPLSHQHRVTPPSASPKNYSTLQGIWYPNGSSWQQPQLSQYLHPSASQASGWQQSATSSSSAGWSSGLQQQQQQQQQQHTPSSWQQQSPVAFQPWHNSSCY